jgi:hypothetical protein
MLSNTLRNESAKAVSHYFYSWPRSFFMGAGLSYAIQNEKYWEIPVLVLFPTVYSGYYSYKNKDDILAYLKKQFPMRPSSFF